MNFNTLSPSAKILKKQESYLSGHPVTDKEVPHIAVICGTSLSVTG
ncbi:MAG: hypothetical protein FWC00_06165 [Firmicutes bacterium]|nr:hypothetical protein [Bacillota bacterium]